MERKKEFKRSAIAAFYDTETTTIGEGENSRSFPSLFIFNDFRGRNIRQYNSDDKIVFCRTADDAAHFVLHELIDWGYTTNQIPVVCAYNLMFDLQPLLAAIASTYDVRCNAQSSTSVYTFDIVSGNDVLLRFWDLFFLERRGVAAMGETAGLEKAIGDWDYSRKRTQYTKLSKQEKHYAARDVQVLPAYLRYTLEANDFIGINDLSTRCLTKTSINRLFGVRKIGGRTIDGKRKLLTLFEQTCREELPKTYEEYALQKACFRGGWTFTAGKTAQKVVKNVASLDVTSMHHAFINGSYVPHHFHSVDASLLQAYAEKVITTSTEKILAAYDIPFAFGFHAAIRFDNIRLKEGSCFDDWKLALIPQAKFGVTIEAQQTFGNSESKAQAEAAIRTRGFCDKAIGARFAFGKLYAASSAVLHLTEYELWCISKVYDFDCMTVLSGELATNMQLPPDYITLQSNYFFAVKNDAKFINNHYKAGEPYAYDIPETVPDGIKRGILSGEKSKKSVEEWYGSTVKGSFNGIYGTQAQDVFKPRYIFEDGHVRVDKSDVASPENFAAKREEAAKHPRVLYTYGMRIVARSRMHLCIAMMMLYKHFGKRIDVTGGDTDSLKIRCDADVSDEELVACLAPLHVAVDNAIERTQRRVRRTFDDLTSDLKDVGNFDVENCGNSKRYVKHMESWNKARISLDSDGKVHVTCAGLSQPDNEYGTADFVQDLSEVYGFDAIAPLVLGYNTSIDSGICHFLQTKRPDAFDVIDEDVTDYLGNVAHVKAPCSVALYDDCRVLGDTSKFTNASTVDWLKEHGTDVDTHRKSCELVHGEPVLKLLQEDGSVIFYTLEGIQTLE